MILLVRQGQLVSIHIKLWEFLKKLLNWLPLLREQDIHYFNLFQPFSTPEPSSPDKEDALKNG